MQIVGRYVTRSSTCFSCTKLTIKTLAVRRNFGLVGLTALLENLVQDRRRADAGLLEGKAKRSVEAIDR